MTPVTVRATASTANGGAKWGRRCMIASLVIGRVAATRVREGSACSKRQHRLVEPRIGIRLQAPPAADLVVSPQPHPRVEGVVGPSLVLVPRRTIGKTDGDVLAVPTAQIAGQALADQ